jgi:hypothetical protein
MTESNSLGCYNALPAVSMLHVPQTVITIISTKHTHFFVNPLLFASCTDTVKLLEARRGVLSSTPPYK